MDVEAVARSYHLSHNWRTGWTKIRSSLIRALCFEEADHKPNALNSALGAGPNFTRPKRNGHVRDMGAEYCREGKNDRESLSFSGGKASWG